MGLNSRQNLGTNTALHTHVHTHIHTVEEHTLKLTLHCRSTDTSCINTNGASGPQ